MNRFQRRQQKRLEAKKEQHKLALVIPAAMISSAWSLIEAEYMKRRPWLVKADADYLRSESKPLYEAREGFTRLY